MSRGLTTALIGLLSATEVWPVWFVNIDMPTTPSYSWTGVGTTSQLGQSWSGVGEHGFVSGIQSSKEIRSYEVTMGIVGIPANLITPSILQKSRSQQYQGRAVNIYLTGCNLATGVPALPPELIWSGFADIMTFRYGQTISVAMTAESLSTQLSRTNGLKMTTENHNKRLGSPSPRDLFFDSQSRLAGVPRPLLQGT